MLCCANRTIVAFPEPSFTTLELPAVILDADADTLKVLFACAPSWSATNMLSPSNTCISVPEPVRFILPAEVCCKVILGFVSVTVIAAACRAEPATPPVELAGKYDENIGFLFFDFLSLVVLLCLIQ